MNKPFISKEERSFQNARGSILIIVILSVVNIFAIAFGDSYFLFSTYLPQIFISIAAYLGDPELLTVMVVLSLVYILPYFLSWLFSKKHVGWMIAALVLFSVDSVFFLVDFISLLAAGEYSFFLDLIIRIYALVSLIMGVVYGFKRKKEQADEPTAGVQLQTEEAFSYGAVRKITISRKKSFVGCAVAIIVYIHGQEVCRLKNGETQTFSAPTNAFALDLMFTSGQGSNSVSIPAGEQDLKYESAIKMKYANTIIELTPIN